MGTDHAAELHELHATAAERLRADDQRYTASRRSIVEALAAAERPPTIPELLLARPGLAQSSAYRNLAVLEQVGVVRRIVTSDEHARFELAEDLTGHHHHLVCATCGRVDDFTVSPQLERSLDTALARVADDTGFELDHHRLDLVGTCRACK
jgi:Fur family transcriptional regulator, ferric uptake regulator